MAFFLGESNHVSLFENTCNTQEDTKQSLHIRQPEIQQVPHDPLQTSDSTKLCENHLGEPLEFYCKNHETYLCKDCVKFEHEGSSCSVCSIRDLKKPRTNPVGCTDTLKPIAAIITKCQELSTTLQEKVNRSDFSYTDIINDVRTFKQEVNRETDELENFLKVELKAMQEQSSNGSSMVNEIITSSSTEQACQSSERTISEHEDDDLLLELQCSSKNKNVLGNWVRNQNKNVIQDDDDLLLH